jgi:hypothetical protein
VNAREVAWVCIGAAVLWDLVRLVRTIRRKRPALSAARARHAGESARLRIEHLVLALEVELLSIGRRWREEEEVRRRCHS